MTSATEKLRKLLDERGVKYRLNESTKVFEWNFGGTDGEGSALATEVDGGINIMANRLTPEQAIAATLGCKREAELWRGTCRIEHRGTGYYCSECDAMVGSDDVTSELHIDANAIELWCFCPRCGAVVGA